MLSINDILCKGKQYKGISKKYLFIILREWVTSITEITGEGQWFVTFP